MSRSPLRQWHIGAWVGLLLALHAALLAISATRHSPVVNEVLCLPAGLSHLYLGQFDVFRVNPPLVSTVASLPVALVSPKTDWQSCDPCPVVRTELNVSKDFLRANEARALGYFTMARWACIPFSLLGGYVCFLFAWRLHGIAAGFMALTLWCFCPYILGHGSLITSDVPAAAMGIAACYSFWRWLSYPGPVETMWASIILGLAELTKFTLLVFYPLWILIWLIYKLSERRLKNGMLWLQEGCLLLGMFLLSVMTINLGYGFEGSFQPLGKYSFQTRFFSGLDQKSSPLPSAGNRFAGTWLGALPVPLPMNFVQGIDTQRLDFEQKQKKSYLGSAWRFGGWWYYYLYALAVKLPLGTLGLVALGGLCLFSKTYRSTWQNEVFLLLSIAAILTLVSSQTGFSIHSRYAIPLLPFVYIWCSRLARSIGAKHGGVAIAGLVLLGWSVGSSLWCYPHNLSYFNELAGGPLGGANHLLDSNIAWGQDIYFLKHWHDKNPKARPLHLAYYGLFDPRLAGIKYSLPPVGLIPPSSQSSIPPDQLGPRPGWYAIDMNHLHGARLAATNYDGGWQRLADDQHDVTYFQRFQPVAMAGYSIYIYHVTPDEANRVRRELGLPKLPKDWRPREETDRAGS